MYVAFDNLSGFLVNIANLKFLAVICRITFLMELFHQTSQDCLIFSSCKYYLTHSKTLLCSDNFLPLNEICILCQTKMVHIFQVRIYWPTLLFNLYSYTLYKIDLYRSVEGNQLDGAVPPNIWSNITFTGNRTLILYGTLHMCSFLILFGTYVNVRYYLNNAGTSKITPLTLFRLHSSLQKLSLFCKFLYHADVSSLSYALRYRFSCLDCSY
jgi:hypothetical protein